MFMRLFTKNMQETSPGTYKAGYSLVMPGQWAFYFVLRDKKGDATTSAYPRHGEGPRHASCYPSGRPQSRPCAVLPAADLDCGLRIKETD